MAEPRIGGGPGNTSPEYQTKSVLLAGSAITKGQVVAIDTSATSTAIGYTVVPAASGAAGTACVVGVALEAIASGGWGEICTGGYCATVNTDGSVAAGEYLVAHTVAGECDTMAEGEEAQVFGWATAGDVDTVDTVVAFIFRRM